MSLIISVAIVVLGNIVSHYAIKWLDSIFRR